MIMKTTIELKGYEIVIEETEEGVTVMASKDGETVEEFSLDAEVEMHDDEDMEDDDHMHAFGEKEEEEDMEDDMEDGEEYEEEMDEEDEDMDEEEDEMEEDEMEEDEVVNTEAPKLESFSSFIAKSKKSNRK